MATYLSDQKKQKIYDKCCEIPTKTKFILRKIASFIVTLVLYPYFQKSFLVQYTTEPS